VEVTAMDFPGGLFPGGVLWAAHLGAAPILFYALYTAPWGRLRDAEQLHVFLGACVSLLMLWSLRAGILPGLNFHLLGVTALTLMFGWRLAMVGVGAVVVGITLNGGANWETLSLNVLVMGMAPIAVTQTVLWAARRYLPHHFFIYVFINAFLAGGLCILAVGFTASLLMWGSGVYELEALGYGYLAYLPMMFFPEGLINGTLMTIFVAYRPHWVDSFDDAKYLRPG
jgi:uncharacterized membrane protein